MAELVGIIDYGMGNIKSVFNAIEYIGEESIIIQSLDDFEQCSHLILPGVGAYSKATENIQRLKFLDPILAHINDKKPLLGICLGMQLFSSSGTEGGNTKGLNIIDGEVKKLDVSLHIPHVGWNNITIKNDHPIFEDIKRDVDFYFVHSYEFKLNDENNLLASTHYEKEVTAIVSNNGSVVGIQFHPEKSQENGLKILENFCHWDGS